MDFEKFMKKLEKQREKNKGILESQKSKFIGMKEDAEYSVILATEKGAAIIGTKHDTMVVLSCLFNSLMEKNILNEQEIIGCLETVKSSQKLSPSELKDILDLFWKWREK